MSDIFREVDEEVRRDRVAEFWKKHQTLIIAAVGALLLAVAGWRYYTSQKLAGQQAAGVAFEQALALATSGKSKEAVEALDPLARSAPDGHRLVARFLAAGEIARTDAGAGRDAFRTLAADGAIEPALRDLAALKALALEIDTLPYAEVESKAGPLAAPTQPFRHLAREILVLSAYKAGQFEQAAKTLDLIVTDADTPPGTRQRAEFLTRLVKAGPVPRAP